MKLIVGLGNPGESYKNTRHNAGFKAVDSFCDSKKWENKKKWNAMALKGELAGEKAIFIKPQTFMNESGSSVLVVKNYLNIPTKDIIIIYDDIDIPIGSARIRSSGSSGGHKGIESIIKKLKTKDIPRIKIGIAQKISGRQKIPSEKYVLENFSKNDEKKLKEIIEEIKKYLTKSKDSILIKNKTINIKNSP